MQYAVFTRGGKVADFPTEDEAQAYALLLMLEAQKYTDNPMIWVEEEISE